MKAPRALLPLLCLLLAAPSARAHEFDVDQSCTPEIWSLYSVRLMGPLGQEFVPALNVMDAAEIWIESMGTGPDATLRVRVHGDSIAGNVLGASAEVPVAGTYTGPVHFDFASPVALVPGQVHVLEVQYVSGEGNLMIGAGDDRPYPDGRAILLGAPVGSTDLWFRTGADHALPVRVASWGAVKAAYR